MRKILFDFGVIFFLVTSILIPFNTTQAGDTGVSWECTMYCNESSGAIDSITFGESQDANDGPPADTYDVAKPPTPFPPFVRAYLGDNLPGPYSALWKDYRRFPDSYKVWNLSIQWVPVDGSSPSTLTITWDSNLIDKSEYSTINLCTNTGTLLKNMRMDNTYTFSCPAYVVQNFKIIGEQENTPPRSPSIPLGETIGFHGTTYLYTTSCTDSDADDVYYQFDWGDGVVSTWLGPYPSGQMIQTSYMWRIPGVYQVKAHSKDTYDQLSPWSSPVSIEMQNRIPSQPTNPSPLNGALNIQSAPTLSWAGTDPDGDILSYTVFFSTINPPEKLVDNQSGSSFHPGSLDYNTTYYWKIVSSDGFGGMSSSPVWSFTTQASNGGGSEQPGNDTNQTNRLPIADASLSEQTGFVGAFLVFNGSRSYDPDGYLTKWTWDFGDGTNGSGERMTHVYQRLGIYRVNLTVTDDDGGTGIDTISVEVGIANRPPNAPSISGTRIGTKNQAYVYTVSATDADNDFLQYMISWGDGTQNTSLFIPNGTVYSVSHSWTTSGKYQVSAKASDNSTFSNEGMMDVFIDVTFVSNHGFLFDADNNGQIDSFFINNTGTVTLVQSSKDGAYYLDTDNDGNWNYLYNPSSGSLTPLHSNVTVIENPWFFIGIMCVAIIIIGIIVYLYKKNYF